MLTKDCECYENGTENCPKCGGTTRVNEEEDLMVFVNVYSVTRHYGGPEEGGWYYNWHQCRESVPCKNKYSDAIAEVLKKDYEHENEGNIYSVNGGREIVVYIERKPAESQSKEQPVYQ